MFTAFFDMSSGGSDKTEFEYIVIEGSESEAAEIFCNTFNRDPYNTTCECCGQDYSIETYDSLQEAIEHREADKIIYKDLKGLA
jgi:hypothetical protein